MAYHLNEQGELIIAIPHPAFNEADNGDTMYKSFDEDYIYSKKGAKVLYTHRTDKSIYFTDFHWMIEDYVDCIKSAGLVVKDIKEPLPTLESKDKNPTVYEARIKYPIMIIFVCSK
ncbi:hypothetical protein CL622_05530 [archaeon]|nr:hypothetical protein [archaeon]|tara:strand:- start:217 stop:564 length:348 start_codon:yes stop_codon:yes gene_type:complete